MTEPTSDDSRACEVPLIGVAAALGAFRLLVAACNRLDAESEEYDLPDGWGCGAQMEFWSEFRTALERAVELLALADGGSKP